MRTELGRSHGDLPLPAGTSGRTDLRGKDAAADATPSGAARAKMVAQIKQELQSEMGLLPVRLLRERKESFVELNAYDVSGKSSYGTAGYLGNGYFVTVKHAVVALKDEDNRDGQRKISSIRVMYQGKEVPARLIDAGDADAGSRVVAQAAQHPEMRGFVGEDGEDQGRKRRLVVVPSGLLPDLVGYRVRAIT